MIYIKYYAPPIKAVGIGPNYISLYKAKKLGDVLSRSATGNIFALCYEKYISWKFRSRTSRKLWYTSNEAFIEHLLIIHLDHGGNSLMPAMRGGEAGHSNRCGNNCSLIVSQEPFRVSYIIVLSAFVITELSLTYTLFKPFRSISLTYRKQYLSSGWCEKFVVKYICIFINES